MTLRLPKSTPILLSLGFAWIGMVAIGWSALLRHTYTPSDVDDHCPHPSIVGSTLEPGHFHIVVFAHPYCPCTRATLNKLDESLTRLRHQVSVRIIFATAGFGESVVRDSFNATFARRLPGVTVEFDDTGFEVSRFGAKVSGEVFGFDDGGRCVFHGGLTAGRGHEGDSASQNRLESLVAHGSTEFFTAPVYGCTLPTITSRK